jgi:FkbM family methyltransferase
MARYMLRGVALDLPEHALRGGLAQALETGRYESAEADAIQRHLRPGDRFLDLGAGLGYLCCLAAQVLGPEAVMGVEAGPDTAELARANLDRNGFAAAGLRHGAVVAPGQGGKVAFGQRPAFWASALSGPAGFPANATVVEVPALPVDALLAEHAPTVLCCDIEGAELEVLAAPLPAPLRVIVTEIHPALYGLAGTKRLFDALSASGFAFSPQGARGATVVFQRIGP